MADHIVGGLHCADATNFAAGFVLGALEPAEADTVRAHLAGCPEPHAEFSELGSVVPALFETVDLVEPPAALRDRILAAAAADTQRTDEAQRAPTQPTLVALRPIVVPRVVDSRRSGWAGGLFRRPIWVAVALAAALAVVALGAWNLQLRDQLSGLTAYQNGVAAVLDKAAQPGAQLAVLAAPATGVGANGLAVVGDDGSVALVMRDLAPTTGAQVYEAWLIAGSGAPIPIGGFAVGAGGSATFTAPHPSLGGGVTIALTLEPGPGATTPTLPIIAVGVTAAQAS